MGKLEIEKKDIPVMVLSILLIVLGTWRVPNWNMREFLELSFLFCSTIFFSSLILLYIKNIWIGLFLILAFIAHLDFKSITYNRPWSVKAFLFILVGIIIYFLSTYFIDNTSKNISILKNAVCIIALTHVFFLILQFLKIDPFHINKRTGLQAIIGMLTNKNEVSTLLGVSGICFFRKRWFWFLIPVLLGLLIAKSFVGILTLFITSFIFILVTYWRKTLWYISIIYLLIGISGLGIYAKYIDPPSINVRIQVWEETINHMKEVKYLIFGRGLGYFKEYTIHQGKFNRIDQGFGALWWQTANNEFVQGFFEWGSGLILIILGFIINVLKRNNSNAFCLATLGGVITACNCTYLFHNGLNAMIGIILLILIEKELRLEKKRRRYGWC